MGVTEIDAIIPASADEAESAAFRSVEAALRFTFGNRHRGEPDSLARHQKRVGAAPRFADAEERAAWAGDIRRRVATMSDVLQATLIVRFAPRALPCACRRACCSGWARNGEWADAVGMLTERSIEAVAGMISNRQLRDGIVRRWSGAEKVNLGVLADRCAVHRNTAGKQAKLVRSWLEQRHRRALEEAHLCMRGVEVIAPLAPLCNSC